MLRETTCSRRIIQHAAYTAFSLLALVACAEPPTTSSDRRPSAAIQQRDSTERPFYYYQDRPIYLDLDPEFIVFDSPLSTAPQVARAITEGLGVSVADVRALPQAPGHWSLHLPPSTTP